MTAAHDRRVALSVTTVGILAATLNSSILLISLPAIFNGLGLDPLAPENISYLLWMLMGYLLVTAVLVVTFGRLGDQYGRAKLFNLGFLIFTIASVALRAGAQLRLGRRARDHRAARRAGRRRRDADGQLDRDHHRRLPAGPARLRARASTRSPRSAGSFLGLVIGGLLSEWHWRAVFWVSVPVGIWGTWMGYRTLHDKPRDASATRRHRLVGQPHLRRRPDRAAGRHHLRPAALRRPHHGLDVARRC